MADITFGQDAEQKNVQASDSSEPRKLSDKHNFDLNELWGAKWNAPKEQDSVKSLADALPRLIVDNKNAATQNRRVLDGNQDHSEVQNGSGIKQQQPGELLDDMKTIINGA